MNRKQTIEKERRTRAAHNKHGEIVFQTSKPTDSQLERLEALREQYRELGGNDSIIKEPETMQEAHFAINSLRRLKNKLWEEIHAKEAGSH